MLRARPTDSRPEQPESQQAAAVPDSSRIGVRCELSRTDLVWYPRLDEPSVVVTQALLREDETAGNDSGEHVPYNRLRCD